MNTFPRDVINNGGHVTSIFSDRKYNFNYDNKRILSDSYSLPGLLDSSPYSSINDYNQVKKYNIILKNINPGGLLVLKIAPPGRRHWY